MRKEITFPTIKVEHFISETLSGPDVNIYHMFVNGDFYRAFGTKEECIAAMEIIATVELEGI